MATFNVEDGSGVQDANAYIPVNFADQFHEVRGNTAWGNLGPDEKEQAIVRATDYVDKRFGKRFIGWRFTRDQGLEWPRLDAYDQDDFRLDDVPKLLKRAVAEYAMRAAIYNILAPDPLRSAPSQDFSTNDQNRVTSASGAVKRKHTVVGPVETETEYETPVDMADKANGARSGQSGLVNDWYIPEYPEADLWIEELLRPAHGGITLGRGD